MRSSAPFSSQRTSDTNTNGALKKRITFAEQDTKYSPSPLFESMVDPASSTNSLININGEYISNDDITKNKQQQQQQQSPLSPPLTLPMIVRPHPLYPVHRFLSEKVESMNLFKRLSASLDSWSLIEEAKENDFRLYDYNCQLSTSSRLSLIRADGCITGKWSAEQLCSAVQCFGARKTCKL